LSGVRERVAADGSRSVAHSRVRLDRVSARGLEREARAAGLAPAGRRAIAETDDHVGSEVVVLGG